MDEWDARFDRIHRAASLCLPYAIGLGATLGAIFGFAGKPAVAVVAGFAPFITVAFVMVANIWHDATFNPRWRSRR